jgi:PadR family transcriptional regulator PadR
MDITAWQSQLRKGAAEMVVLASLRDGERYGLQILEAVGGVGGIVSEGSLYPLLNRLERDGKLIARWSMDDPASAHPRKYYRLSPDGAALLAAMRPAWAEFRTAMASILEDPQ